MTNPLRMAEQSAIANHHVSVFGSFMQQNPAALLSLNRLLLAHDFTTIIELGTHDGGLSTFFALYCLGSQMPAYADDPREPSLYKNNTHHKSPKGFFTYDNVRRDIPRAALLTQMGTHVCQADTLNDAATIESIRNLIKTPGTTLLLCDGGDKRKEVALYGPALKPGDFIMVHDWAKNLAAATSLRDKGIWNAWESWWGEDGPTDAVPRMGIMTACKANNITQIYDDEFDDVAWFCGIKRASDYDPFKIAKITLHQTEEYDEHGNRIEYEH